MYQSPALKEPGSTRSSVRHSPTLRTVRMVEATLRQMECSAVSVAELKRKLPKKINHNTLKAVLEYLEESNKIAVSIRGITWIHNTTLNLRRAISSRPEH